MANRPYFEVSLKENEFYVENNIDFTFYSGFAITQKRLSIKSLHNAILNMKPHAKILEVSRRSEHALGTKLSAFNLKFCYDHAKQIYYPVENVFQSSKVFVNGGHYLDLLSVTPAEAKTDHRLKESGELAYFELYGEKWPLTPITMFYDHLYLSALQEDYDLCQKLMEYDTFTDIEFNPKKSLNCQARSVAIAISLLKQNKLEQYLHDLKLFRSIYDKTSKKGVTVTNGRNKPIIKPDLLTALEGTSQNSMTNITKTKVLTSVSKIPKIDSHGQRSLF